ncbi:unnamed protein product [Effrenium voratum]|uniref:Uncharacterized protein n=1 Tax=Effrenium voratum TaxID=2562239 RepID=A0AA36JFX3_9DINO|nr:unnamed protein product [Effrenium voratum]
MEDSVSVRSGTTRYLVDIRAGTQTNMTHPGRRVRRVRRLATGPGRNAISAHPSLERNFSAVDRGPVNDFEQKVLERKLGEEHFRQEEDTQTDPSIQMELDRGEAAPRLRVDFFKVPAEQGKESPLPAECTLLQALLWPEPAAMRQVEQRLRYTVSTSRAASSLGCQVVPLYMPERERRSSKDAKITAPLQLTEVVHRLNKYLAAKNALPRLTEAVATLVKEPDSPTGRIKEERFRLVLEEVASQVLEADEMLAVFPEKAALP